MPEHTPGPWRIDGDIVCAKSDGFTDNVASCAHRRDSDRLANAQLIAAAPEMLEMLRACEDLLARVGDGANPHSPAATKLYGQVRATIAKAEGRE